MIGVDLVTNAWLLARIADQMDPVGRQLATLSAANVLPRKLSSNFQVAFCMTKYHFLATPLWVLRICLTLYENNTRQTLF